MTATIRHLITGTRRLRRRYLERCSTRDDRVPLYADDPEMFCGWRCVPVPPSPDPRWFIIDSSHDRRTEWGRWVEHEAEGEA